MESERVIGNFEDFLDFLVDLREMYNISYDRAKLEKGNEIWYRGHKNGKWDLVPSLFRNKESSDDILENTNCKVTDFEKCKVLNFSEALDLLKKKMEEKDLIQDITKLNYFQIAFLGQHYGLKTPFLDWTSNPLVALYFAVNNYTIHDKNNGISPAFYALRPSKLNSISSLVWCESDHSINEPISIDDDLLLEYESRITNRNDNTFAIPFAIYSKKDFSHRIIRQSGKFTVHSVRRTNVWEYEATERCLIAPYAVEELREYLLLLNVNTSNVYGERDDLIEKLTKEVTKRTK